MDAYKLVSGILKEIANVSVGLNAYESPARPFKKIQKKEKKITHATTSLGSRIKPLGN